MRQKRAKVYKKLMALYSSSFGFRQPYQVLVDSGMCIVATDAKMDLNKQLGVVLQGTAKPMITQCCIHELYLQGKDKQPAVDLAKTFERRKCNHREAIPGDECLTSVVGDTNKHRYVVASQSQPLRLKLRSIPAVPLVHVNRSVIVLEPPSDTTMQQKLRNEEASLRQTNATDKALVKDSKPTTEEPPRKKRKGPKEPNPLSVKKKVKGPSLTPAQKRTLTTQESEQPGEKRKRREDGDEGGAAEEVHEGSGRKRKRKKKGGEHVEGGPA